MPLSRHTELVPVKESLDAALVKYKEDSIIEERLSHVASERPFLATMPPEANLKNEVCTLKKKRKDEKLQKKNEDHSVMPSELVDDYAQRFKLTWK